MACSQAFSWLIASITASDGSPDAISPVTPWFIGLGIASLLAMGLNLWGLWRTCRKHNYSAITILCGKEACLPSFGLVAMIILYIVLSLIYVVFPPAFHDLLL